MISSVFIDRPRLAIVIAIVITIAGALAMLRIPVAQLPDIVPPQVTVTANYPGASANVVESSVAQPIEAQVVGVDKMIYMKSNSGNDGSYYADRQLRPQLQPRHRHGQRQQPGADRAVATAAGGAARGPDGPEAVHLDPGVPRAVQRRSEDGSAVHQQLRADQRAGPVVAHAGRRPGEPVFQVELLDAGVVRHRPADRAQPDARRHHRGDPGAERGGADRPCRRAADRQRPAIPVQPADPGPAGHAGANSAPS